MEIFLTSITFYSRNGKTRRYSRFPGIHLPLLTQWQQFSLPLIIKIHCPSQFCNLAFCPSVQSHEKLKLLGCSLSFQISGSVVESLDEIILLAGTETVKPAELELQP